MLEFLGFVAVLWAFSVIPNKKVQQVDIRHY